jgi:hypothetical protein
LFVGSLYEDLREDPGSWTHVNFTLTRNLMWPMLIISTLIFHGILPWSNFHGPISSKKNQVTKPLGPSLGVNRMWTKRSDHAPESECVFLVYANKRVVLKILKFD